MKRWTMVAVVVAGLQACGGTVGSCDGMTGGLKICIDYEEFPGGKTALQSACGVGQTFSESSCTSADRVGRCRLTTTSSAASSKEVWNYYAPLSAEQAQ